MEPVRPLPAPQLGSLEERLERGDIVPLQPCPFPLPSESDREFLRSLKVRGSKNINFNPTTSAVSGFRQLSDDQPTQLQRILGDFSSAACEALRAALRYTLKPDRATFRPEEEATRRLRITARNDLLHIDAFSTRPSSGWRILRLFVNLHPTDLRVWATSEPFAKLLEEFGLQAGLPESEKLTWMERVLNLFQKSEKATTPYDQFMVRFQRFLKRNADFQEHARRTFWHFRPGDAWLVMSDGIAYAEIRGRYALEHSFFVSPETLALPDLAPAV
ncbi:MAG: Kdo hydroxylase family protein [Gemmataceae bacterium]